MHTLLIFRCVTVYLGHRPSITVSNTRTCIPHLPHHHTYYKYHSIRYSDLSFIHSPSLLSSRSQHPCAHTSLSLLSSSWSWIPFHWTASYSHFHFLGRMTVAYPPHHITSHYHTLISSSFVCSFSTLFDHWFWRHLCGIWIP